jgi:low affinity Fe/Cu permease
VQAAPTPGMSEGRSDGATPPGVPSAPASSSSAHHPRSAGHGEGSLQDWFRRFAHRVSIVVGKAGAFCTALVVIVVWGVTGPLFGFSDTWQLIINTSTTIVTFLMVFLIQSTQNRDAAAIHLKLDELIRATRSARNGMLALEQLSDEQLEELEHEFERLRNAAQQKRERSAPRSAGDESRPEGNRP